MRGLRNQVFGENPPVVADILSKKPACFDLVCRPLKNIFNVTSAVKQLSHKLTKTLGIINLDFSFEGAFAL